MSFFNWFSRKSSTARDAGAKAQPDSDSSDLNRDDRTRPVAGARGRPVTATTPKSTGHGAERSGGHKSHRHAQRELLYNAVREAMIRAGVLSASYKFKVLSLDPRGEQFMVMMDLAQEFGGQTERLVEMEVMIAQNAKSRYNIRVTAVYWRMNERVSIGRATPGVRAAGLSHGPHQAGAAQAVLAATLPEQVIAVPKPGASRYEPIEADEVAAFKQALAAASAQGAATADKSATTRNGPHSYTLLTGFEDTEMPNSPASVPALSATQYGDLI